MVRRKLKPRREKKRQKREESKKETRKKRQPNCSACSVLTTEVRLCGNCRFSLFHVIFFFASFFPPRFKRNAYPASPRGGLRSFWPSALHLFRLYLVTTSSLQAENEKQHSRSHETSIIQTKVSRQWSRYTAALYCRGDRTGLQKYIHSS